MLDDLDQTTGALETDLSGDDLNAIFGNESPAPSDELGASDMSSGTDSAAPSAASAPAAQGQQGVQPTQASAPSTPPQQPPASQPQAPAQPQQPGPQQQAQPSQPASFEQYVAQNYDGLVKSLSEGAFKLTDAEAQAMGTAAPVVASYMARTHLHSMVMVQKAIQAALPDAVGGLVNISRTSAELETKFFGDYPELQSVDKTQMAMLAYGLRQANPQMPVADFMPLLARTVAAAAQVQLKPQRGQPQAFIPAGQNRGGVSPHPTPRSRVNPGVPANGADQLASINDFLRFS